MVAPEPPSDAPVEPSTTIVKTTAADETGARIGVLFVHGMGEQKRGATLQQLADPVIQWIRRWETHNFDHTLTAMLEPEPVLDEMTSVPVSPDYAPAINPTSSPLGYTVIRGETADPSCYEPPTTEFTLVRPARDTGKATRATWVMTEAWWADAFFPPKFSDVARWGLGVGPRFIVRHFELPSSGYPGLPQFLRYGIALAGVLVFEVVIVLLLVLGALPFARNYVRNAILRLIGSFGDPMVLVVSPLTSGAIATAVNHAIAWLRETKRCERIAIVAHSLGTVVCYNILSRSSEGVGLFVTFGSALKKAQILQRVQENDVRLSLGIVLAAGAFGSFMLTTLIAMVYWSEVPAAIRSASAAPDLLAWTWPHLLIVAGSMLAIARLALWRRIGPRVAAALGCLIAAVGGVALLAYEPTAAEPATWQDIDAAAVGDLLASPDILRVGPFLAAAILMGARERYDARRYRSAPPSAYREIESAPHPWPIGSPLVQSLLIVGALVCAVTRVWTPPQLITPLIVLGLVLCYSAVRVPFGNGYIASDGEREDVLPFLFASDRANTPLTWHDYWASTDPVPDGGFRRGNVAQSPRPVELESTPTTNQKSIATDHTTYHENLEQFVGPLVADLMRLTGWADLFTDPEENRVAEASRTRRNARVKALTRASLTLVVSALAAIGYLALRDIDSLTELGNKALAPVMGILKLVIVNSWVERLDHYLPGATFGSILILFVAILWHRLVVFQAWRQWDKADQAAMFRRFPAARDVEGTRAGHMPRSVRHRRRVFQAVGFGMPLVAAGAAIAMSAAEISWWPTS